MRPDIGNSATSSDCWINLSTVLRAYIGDSLASLVSREGLDTRSVIPAKAGIQLTLLWIPAYAGKTIVGRECRTIAVL